MECATRKIVEVLLLVKLRAKLVHMRGKPRTLSVGKSYCFPELSATGQGELKVFEPMSAVRKSDLP
jgi:hypothetical protein